MSKVEDRALEKYPIHSIRIVPARGGGYYADSHLREGFIEGYHQAENDFELTWQDLATIEKLGDDFIKHNQTPMSDEEFYKEILKRYKELKK